MNIYSDMSLCWTTEKAFSPFLMKAEMSTQLSGVTCPTGCSDLVRWGGMYSDTHEKGWGERDDKILPVPLRLQ